MVAGITGVEVRETLPDRVFEDADVQLVDLPTEALIERLRQGAAALFSAGQPHRLARDDPAPHG